MDKFKVGERVVVVGSLDGRSDLDGMTGTIVANSLQDEYDIAVEFDDYIYGHNAGGLGKVGYCRYGFNNEVRPLVDDVVANMIESMF